jgi:hypothetical protein
MSAKELKTCACGRIATHMIGGDYECDECSKFIREIRHIIAQKIAEERADLRYLDPDYWDDATARRRSAWHRHAARVRRPAHV